MPGHVAAAHPDHVWAIDSLQDQTHDGRPVRILTITDEHTREALATPTARRLGADQTVQALEQVASRARPPAALHPLRQRPKLVSQALQDWCRLNHTTTAYIQPDAPWQNPHAESFNRHLRRELLDMESFNTLHEAHLLVEDWRLEYNHYRPHQSLNYQTPAEYAHRWSTETQPAPS